MIRGVLALVGNVLLVPLFGGAGLIMSVITRRFHYAHVGAGFWGRAMLWICGAKVQIEGREILEKNRPAVGVANHTSNLDIYFVCGHAPIPYSIPAKAELFRIPVLGPVMRGLGMVPLDRSRSARDLRQIDKMTELFDKNAILVFFPEGTRSRTGRIRRFKKGAFNVAIRHEVPIIPIAIEGAHRIQPAGSWRIRGGPMTIRVLDPIPTTGLTMDDRDALCDQAYERIVDTLPAEQRPAGASGEG